MRQSFVLFQKNAPRNKAVKYFSSAELVKKIEELFNLKKLILIDEEHNL